MEPDQNIGSSRRETDRLALAIFGELKDLSAEEKQLVLSRLRTPRGVDPGRSTLVQAAIQRFDRECGGRLSKRRYEAWRVQVDDKSLPSATFIAATYGGTWSKAMDGLGRQPALEHAAFRLRAMGRTPDRDEAIQDLRKCAEELRTDSLSLSAYSQWARAKQPHAPSGKVYLLSRDPFIRRFGSFNRALHEAGIKPSKTSNGPWGGQGRYSTESAIKAMKAAHAAVQPELPLTQEQYLTWRNGEYKKAKEAGEWLAIPSYLTVRKLLGSWPKALVASGLISKECGAHYSLGRGQRMSSVQVARGFLAASQYLGTDFTKAEYDRWMASERKIVTRIRPPSSSLVRLRLSGWRCAKRALEDALATNNPVEALTRQIDWSHRNR